MLTEIEKKKEIEIETDSIIAVCWDALTHAGIKSISYSASVVDMV